MVEAELRNAVTSVGFPESQAQRFGDSTRVQVVRAEFGNRTTTAAR